MNKWTRIKYHPNLPLGADGRKVTASPEHIRLSKDAAREGMVLLKNEGGALPLRQGAKVALFGKGTYDYVKGGGGSGDVTVPYVRNLADGLRQYPERVTLFDETDAFYAEHVRQLRRGALSRRRGGAGGPRRAGAPGGGLRGHGDHLHQPVFQRGLGPQERL